MMKRSLQRSGLTLVAVTLLAVGTSFYSQCQAQNHPITIASVVDREISDIEKQIVDTAEAMPEDKFNFSPESLNIPGDDYKGVRTFALQVKHVAASDPAPKNWTT
jgi:hypothetical protein